MVTVVKKHYHWVIFSVVLLQLFLYIGIYNNLESLFIGPVTAGMGISRGSFSLAYSALSLAGFFSNFFSGFFLSKLGYRKNIVLFLATTTLAFIGLSVAKNVLTLALCFAAVGLGNGVTVNIGYTVIVRSWFHRHQGTVLGLLSASTGLGGSLLCIVMESVMRASSWRTAYFACGVAIFMLLILMAVIVRNTPEEMGLDPLGKGQYDKKKNRREFPVGLDMKFLVKRPSFYVMLLATFLSAVGLYTMSRTVLPHFQNSGLTREQATAMQSMMLLIMTATKMGTGFFADRIGAKAVTMICMVGGAIGQVLMLMVNGVGVAIAAVLFLDLALPISMLTVPLLTPELFGMKGQTAAQGIFMSAATLSILICGPGASMVFDATGSYKLVYVVGLISMLLAIVLHLVLFKMVEKDRELERKLG